MPSFLHYSDITLGYPPIPKNMVYRARIKLPSSSFENVMSLNECESEAACKEKQVNKNSDDSKNKKSNYPQEYGFHISTASDLNFCFQKYGKNCKVFIAVKFDSILEMTHSKVIVESFNVGCRLRPNDPEVDGDNPKWDSDACQAMKSSTPESIHCRCEAKSSFRLELHLSNVD